MFASDGARTQLQASVNELEQENVALAQEKKAKLAEIVRIQLILDRNTY